MEDEGWVCPECGNTEIIENEKKRQTTCSQCGYVLKENNISNDATFMEDSHGISKRQGTYIPSHGWNNRSGIRGGAESRLKTIEQGKTKITGIASILKIHRSLIDAATGIFSLAVEQNCTQGRNMENICGSCLYIACRRDNKPYMLLDFAECLQRDIVGLARTFRTLREKLQLSIPIIDPTLYIHRFADKLEFENKCHDVANTAVKLVCNMKRDWMVTGRRPSGICAAALLIAARIHGFKRSLDEVSGVTNVAQSTIRTRINEFKATETSNLTLREFKSQGIERLTEAHDPPAFTKKQQTASKLPGKLNSNHSHRRLSSLTSSLPPAIPLSFPLPESDKTLSRPTKIQKVAQDDLPEGVTAEDIKESLSDVDDDEINDLILNDEESAEKKKQWHQENDEYLRQLEDKRELAKKKGGTSSQKKKRKRIDYSADNAKDAVLKLIHGKKMSKKINLAVLEELIPKSEGKEEEET
eukprot:CAMPEP_0167747626 /NCGR_PEP_ID=MMETSP0110_2-20121227/4388_1 /TAXON_ID=629695 /ORGANISM="Gymnochlora sp., Strain CCMP2014" /LENGTH=470 /DNA_ID=CAMNT_0007632553 /DNA_START=55 /DNA_END=1467 /DNA_ORIENTATION=+